MSVSHNSERKEEDLEDNPSSPSYGEPSSHPYFHLKQFSSQPQSYQDRIDFTLSHMEPLIHAERPKSSLSTPDPSSVTKQQHEIVTVCTPPPPIPDTLCVHPISFHSFTSPSTLSFMNLISSKFKTCAICLEKLSGWSYGRRGGDGTLGGDFIGGNTANIVTCLACGMYAHRSCALAHSLRGEEEEEQDESFNNGLLGVNTPSNGNVCPVNLKLLEERLAFQQQQCKERIRPPKEVKEKMVKPPVPIQTKGDTTSASSFQKKVKPLDQASSGPMISPTPPTAMKMFPTPTTETNDEVMILVYPKDDNDSDSDNDDTWSVSGPPVHWALSSPEALKGIKPPTAVKETETTLDVPPQQQNWLFNLSKALQQNMGRVNQNDNGEMEHVETGTSSQSGGTIVFGSISQPSSGEEVMTKEDDECPDENEEEQKVRVKQKSTKVVSNILKLKQSCSNDESHGIDSDENDKDSSTTNDETSEGMKSLLDTKDPVQKQSALRKGASDAMAIASKTNSTRKNIGFASIAGGVAGGVVGLAFAGPAGVYIGAKIGQAVGVAGAVVEGTIGVGVLVAGVTGTVLTVNQLKEENKRMITIGENGTDCKVVLVRPNVMIDPIWDDITNRARLSAPVGKNGLAALIDNQKVEKQKRRKRDEEILKSEDNELSTKEKILLLVSSSLNDKRSLPGHVYRELILEHQVRFESRTTQQKKDEPSEQHPSIDPRITRQDTHAVIKHVTATLLEVRPGFCASPRITEISATAVETMVFGRVFECVMQEIREETRENDLSLIKNIEECQGQITFEAHEEHISSKAIHALQMIPTCYSVAEKLRCCVTLLETISDQCSDVNADNLLKMVCQHIVFARVPALNAEIVFLEEFARDEQLLRGKEGYALVTMQASLHFMNASTNFVADIFVENDAG